MTSTSRLTTEEAAARLGIKAQTLRAAVCRSGHYCGVFPHKAPNRFLYWPADDLEVLTGDKHQDLPASKLAPKG